MQFMALLTYLCNALKTWHFYCNVIWAILYKMKKTKLKLIGRFYADILVIFFLRFMKCKQYYNRHFYLIDTLVHIYKLWLNIFFYSILFPGTLILFYVKYLFTNLASILANKSNFLIKEQNFVSTAFYDFLWSTKFEKIFSVAKIIFSLFYFQQMCVICTGIKR